MKTSLKVLRYLWRAFLTYIVAGIAYWITVAKENGIAEALMKIGSFLLGGRTAMFS